MAFGHGSCDAGSYAREKTASMGSSTRRPHKTIACLAVIVLAIAALLFVAPATPTEAGTVGCGPSPGLAYTYFTAAANSITAPPNVIVVGGNNLLVNSFLMTTAASATYNDVGYYYNGSTYSVFAYYTNGVSQARSGFFQVLYCAP